MRTTIEPDDENATAVGKTFVPTTLKLGLSIDVSCIGLTLDASPAPLRVDVHGALTAPTDRKRQPNSGP